MSTIVKELDKNNPRDVQKAVKAMEKTIWKLANRYARNQFQEREELFAFGMEGLTRAIEKWDSTRGASFSTHAYWWIHERIRYEAKRMYDRVNSTSGVEIETAIGDDCYDMDVDTAIDLERKVNKLDEVSKAIVNARHEGYSFDEIAKGLTKLGHKFTLHQVRNTYIKSLEG